MSADVPDWIRERRGRTGRVTAGEWAGETLVVEPDDRDEQGWHLYVGPWDVWADDAEGLLEWLADRDHAVVLDEL